jgi:DNA repair photolyase
MFYHECDMRPEYREEPCRSALNRVKGMMFGWSLNPYMGCAHRCTFCYVRAFEKRADRPSDDRYGASIRVKTNVVEVLRRELARKTWKGDLVAIGAATDPYQPAEGRYRLTRGCIATLGEARNPLAIITRGPMIVRDIDVLVEASRWAKAAVTFSVPTLDDEIWRLTEPNTPPPRQRLRALSRLREAGIEAGVGMAPILPGLSDRPELMADVVRAARDAGATSIWTNVLYLRPGTREHFLDHLARDWPELLPRYERLYEGRAYLPRELVEPVRREVAELRNRFAVDDPEGMPRPPGAIESAPIEPATRLRRRAGPTRDAPPTATRRSTPRRPAPRRSPGQRLPARPAQLALPLMDQAAPAGR